jgi:hypothetical protein
MPWPEALRTNLDKRAFIEADMARISGQKKTLPEGKVF